MKNRILSAIIIPMDLLNRRTDPRKFNSLKIWKIKLQVKSSFFVLMVERPPASDGSCPPAAVRRKSTSLEPQHLISISKIQDLPLPSREIADQLVNIYFKYVQTIFPYLHEPSFRQYYNTIWEKEQQPDKDIDSLQYCILYLVFALGCQFSTLFEDPIQGGDTYLNRAKSLLGFCVFDDGSVRVVQALLLMGVYLQSTSRPNRCWNVVGMAIRVAQGIKLHVETTAEHLVEREIRRRAWWGCVLMDRLIFPISELILGY